MYVYVYVCVRWHEQNCCKNFNYISHTRIAQPGHLIKPALQLLGHIFYELTISHEIFKGPKSQKHIKHELIAIYMCIAALL